MHIQRHEYQNAQTHKNGDDAHKQQPSERDLQYVHISLMEPLKTKRGVGRGDERIASSLRKQKNVYQYDKTVRLKQDHVSLTFTEKVSCRVGGAGGYGS